MMSFERFKLFSGRVLNKFREFIVALIGTSLAQDRDYKFDTCHTCDTYSFNVCSHYGPKRTEKEVYLQVRVSQTVFRVLIKKIKNVLSQMKKMYLASVPPPIHN